MASPTVERKRRLSKFNRLIPYIYKWMHATGSDIGALSKVVGVGAPAVTRWFNGECAPNDEHLNKVATLVAEFADKDGVAVL